MANMLINFFQNETELSMIDNKTKNELKDLKKKADFSYLVIKSLIECGIINSTENRYDEKNDEIDISNKILYNNNNYYHQETWVGTNHEDGRVLRKVIENIDNKININFFRHIKEYNVCIKNLIQNNKEIPKIFNFYDARTKKNQREINYNFEINHVDKIGEIAKNCPTTTLKLIKNIADLFNFVIIPIDFMHELAYKCDRNNSKEKIIRAINLFDGIYGNDDKNYILCPIKYLDLIKASKSNKDFNVYFGGNLKQYEMMIRLNLPVFRTIFNSLEKLEDSNNVIKQQIEETKKNVTMMQNNINQISMDVNKKIADLEASAKMQNAKSSSMEDRIASLEEWRIACLTDPMIFKCEDITNDNSSCKIGFAWGPEFEQTIIDEYGIQMNNCTNIIGLIE